MCSFQLSSELLNYSLISQDLYTSDDLYSTWQAHFSYNFILVNVSPGMLLGVRRFSYKARLSWAKKKLFQGFSKYQVEFELVSGVKFTKGQSFGHLVMARHVRSWRKLEALQIYVWMTILELRLVTQRTPSMQELSERETQFVPGWKGSYSQGPKKQQEEQQSKQQQQLFVPWQPAPVTWLPEAAKPGTLGAPQLQQIPCALRTSRY